MIQGILEIAYCRIDFIDTLDRECKPLLNTILYVFVPRVTCICMLAVVADVSSTFCRHRTPLEAFCTSNLGTHVEVTSGYLRLQP